ncbi:MAG: response regulator [Syntrophobacteraceae bacterium]
MLHILLVTARKDRMQAFIDGISRESEVQLELATAGSQALEMVRSACPDLVIVDSTSEKLDAPDMVRRIIGVNAMANTAVVSSLSEAEFHDKYEGLGILSRLPEEPGGNDAKSLVQKLRKLMGIN